MKNIGHRTILEAPVIAIMLAVILSSNPVFAASGVSISGFSVTPALASFGTTATAIVTVHNLNPTNSVSLTVTVADNGVNVATQSLTVPADSSATSQIQFKTVAVAPHCYIATTSPVASSKGFCESGGINPQLAGTALAINALALVAPYLAVAAVAVGAFSVVFLKRRAKN